MKTNDLKGKYEVEENDELGLAMAGQGYDEVRVKDESGDKAYFTITPRIVKAFSRNAHDFAVWDTIKDIAGEKGECYLNTEQIAVLSGCSAGQVSSSRKYWMKLGFLKGEMRKDPGFSQAVWHLSIPDIWQKNIEWCEKHPKIADRLAFRKAHRSLHRMKPSPSEGKPSPSETKKNLIKKNKDLLDAEIHYHLKPKSIKEAFATYFKLTPNWEAKYNRQYLEWLVENGATPEQVEHAASLWRKDKRFNWKAPDLKGVQEHWLELIDGMVDAVKRAMPEFDENGRAYHA